MKTLFIHDTTFVKSNNHYYTKDGLDNKVFQTYRRFFGEIFVIARYEDINDNNSIYVKKENEIENVHFICGKSFKEAANLVKEYIVKADFIILRVHSFISCLCFNFIKKNHKQYLAESVSCAWDCLWNHSLKGKLVAPFMYFMTKKIVKDAKYVTYVSNFLKFKYPTSGENIVCSDVRLENCKTNYYKKNHVFTNTINICTIANVDVKYKGHKYVVEALNYLKNNNIKYKYYLVGGGEGIKLKKLIGKYGLNRLNNKSGGFRI